MTDFPCSPLITATLLLLSVLPVQGQDNAVVGVPIVTCEEHGISVALQTTRPFRGRLFVKGEHADARCVRDYSGGGGGGGFRDEDAFLVGGQRGQTDAANGRHGFGGGHSWSTGQRDVAGGRSGPSSSSSSSSSSSAFTRPGSSEQSRAHSMDTWTMRGGRGEKGRNDAATSFCQPCACDGSSSAESARARRAPSATEAEAEAADKTRVIGMRVGLDACNAQRDRIASPPGVRVSFVLVVSFHSSFITRPDRAYRVQCLYAETDRTVTAEVDVEMQAPSNLTRTVAPHSCAYRIGGVDGSEGGKVLGAVRVGDRVRHEWHCQSDTPDAYALLVHNCTVQDGDGHKTVLIDERGCTTDPFVLATPSYPSSLTATVDSFVFKFPDRAAVDFQCSLTLCLKGGGDSACDAITPPQCDGSTRDSNNGVARSRRALTSTDFTAQDLTVHDFTASPFDQTWSIHSPRLYVLDPSEGGDGEGEGAEPFFSALSATPPVSPSPSSSPSSSLCLSPTAFGVSVAAVTCIATTSVIVLVMLLAPFSRTHVQKL